MSAASTTSQRHSHDNCDRKPLNCLGNTNADLKGLEPSPGQKCQELIARSFKALPVTNHGTISESLPYPVLPPERAGEILSTKQRLVFLSPVDKWMLY